MFFADATFKIVPLQFKQMLNICADHHGVVVCVAHVLMTTKARPLYTKIFETFHEQFPMFKPKEWRTDFESSLVLGIADNYPEAPNTGNYFQKDEHFIPLKEKFEIYENVSCLCFLSFI